MHTKYRQISDTECRPIGPKSWFNNLETEVLSLDSQFLDLSVDSLSLKKIDAFRRSEDQSWPLHGADELGPINPFDMSQEPLPQRNYWHGSVSFDRQVFIADPIDVKDFMIRPLETAEIIIAENTRSAADDDFWQMKVGLGRHLGLFDLFADEHPLFSVELTQPYYQRFFEELTCSSTASLEISIKIPAWSHSPESGIVLRPKQPGERGFKSFQHLEFCLCSVKFGHNVINK